MKVQNTELHSEQINSRLSLSLKDSDGNEILTDSVIYGSLPGETEKHYFNIGFSPNDGSVEMFASTYGYVHNVTQEIVSGFKLIGSVADNLNLLVSD